MRHVEQYPTIYNVICTRCFKSSSSLELSFNDIRGLNMSCRTNEAMSLTMLKGPCHNYSYNVRHMYGYLKRSILVFFFVLRRENLPKRPFCLCLRHSLYSLSIFINQKWRRKKFVYNGLKYPRQSNSKLSIAMWNLVLDEMVCCGYFRIRCYFRI